MEIDMDFRLRRAKKRITLKEISESTGINISLLSRYENNKVSAGMVNILKIDAFLKQKEA